MPSEALKGHIAMGAAAVIWGLMSPVSKLVMQQGEVSSASLATFRLLGAAILFWLASAFVPREPIERKHRLPLFYASLFGIIFPSRRTLKNFLSSGKSLLYVLPPITTLLSLTASVARCPEMTYSPSA